MKKLTLYILSLGCALALLGKATANDHHDGVSSTEGEISPSFSLWGSSEPITGQEKIHGPSNGGQVTIGAMLKNIPIGEGSTLRLVLTSEDPKVAYDTGDQPIFTNVMSFTIDWPAGLDEASVTYTYKPNGTVPHGMQVAIFVSYMPPFSHNPLGNL